MTRCVYNGKAIADDNVSILFLLEFRATTAFDVAVSRSVIATIGENLIDKLAVSLLYPFAFLTEAM